MRGRRILVARCPECDTELDPSVELCPSCGAIVADYEDYEPDEGSEA